MRTEIGIPPNIARGFYRIRSRFWTSGGFLTIEFSTVIPVDYSFPYLWEYLPQLDNPAPVHTHCTVVVERGMFGNNLQFYLSVGISPPAGQSRAHNHDTAHPTAAR